MKDWNRRKAQTPLLCYIFYAYWVILLIWQNFGGGQLRSGVDVIIKCALLVMLGIYYFSHMTGIRRDVLALIVILCMIYGGIKMSNGMGMSEALYYFFPFLFLLMVYGIGWRFALRKKQLITLCNLIIITVSYIAIYALIFCFDQFIGVFSLSSAYGNELRSFLMSNHEYGLYLSVGIMASILCLEFDPDGNKGRRGLYIAAIVLFSANLILTFSRTSMLALVVMMICYIIAFAKKRLRSVFFCSLAAAVILVLVIPPLREFFWQIVMKENNDAGRDDLTEKAIEIFISNDYMSKVFGRDYFYVEQFLNTSRNISSFHNAYLSQLVSNGIVGVIILTSMTVVSLRDIYVTVKSGAKYSHLAKFFIGFVLSACIFMLFNTSVLYASTIDSFFLTVIASVVPKYVNRAIRDGTFDLPEKENQSGKPIRKTYSDPVK